MEKISTVIIDDDSLFQTVLSGFIKRTDTISLIKAFTNPIEAINYLSQNPVDLVFLDVEMPEMSGLQFIQALEYQPQIILVTSNRAYAVSAFEYNVTDYLLKPLDDYSRFLKSINRARENIQEVAIKKDYIFIKENNRLTKIRFDDIYYIEAYGDYIKIYTQDKFHIALSSLKSVYERLPQNDFLQIHRSYIVKLSKIQNVEGNNLLLDDYSIPFSKAMRETILNKIMQ